MYDFCITYPYSLLLAIGGIMGYFKKGSIVSLAGGVGSATILAILATISLKNYKVGKQCKITTFLSFMVSSGLSYIMWLRFNKSGKLMPSGLVLFLSLTMSLFYIWSMTLGPKPRVKRDS